MPSVPVRNKSDSALYLWYGHTSYHIAAGDTRPVPIECAKNCAKHHDYKDKIEIIDPNVQVEPEPEKEATETPENPETDKDTNEETYLWMDHNFNISDFDGELAAKYAEVQKLKVADVKGQDLIDLVVEHFISN